MAKPSNPSTLGTDASRRDDLAAGWLRGRHGCPAVREVTSTAGPHSAASTTRSLAETGESQSPRATSLRAGVLWNVASLGVLAVSGVLLHGLLGRFYGADSLGVFNQVYAVYILFSQFAVAGCHFSVAKYVAQHADRPRMCTRILTSGLLLGVLMAAAATVLFWFSATAVGRLLDSPAVAIGIAYATPGLFFFAVNKILLSAMNGFRWMRLYAIFSAARPVLLVSSLLALVVMHAAGPTLAGIFSVTEAVLCVALVHCLRRQIRVVSFASIRRWMRIHTRFGLRSFFSGALSELNSRVDVLMLGLFVTDYWVGIYSLAAMVAEGIAQLPIVFRKNFNPLLARLLATGDRPALDALVRRGKRITYGVVVLVAIIALATYPWAIRLLTSRADFQQSWSLFAILVLGVTLASGYSSFRQILLQAGRPAMHTAMIFLLVLINASGNLVLIPLWGVEGAAMATAFSMVASVFLLKAMARHQLGVIL